VWGDVTGGGDVPEVELVTGEGRRLYRWDTGVVSIGRMPTNDLVVPSKHVSRTHAELTYADGWVWITDLSSAFGVWVGEQRVHRHALAVGQVARIAPDVYLTVTEDAPDLAAQPTTHLAALPQAPQVPLEELPTRLHIPSAPAQPAMEGGSPSRWLRATEPTVWGPRQTPDLPAEPSAARRPTPEFAGFEDEHEADVFRRQATNPNTTAPLEGTRQGRPVARLVTCATCGERNAASAVSCHSCGFTLAVPCGACGMSLLAAQDRCPRCHTPNAGFAGRIS
jgi:predicted component of type VI protein secretion system